MSMRLASGKSAMAHAEIEESNRLLYVAMTRARDRLYVAGFEGAKGRAKARRPSLRHPCGVFISFLVPWW